MMRRINQRIRKYFWGLYFSNLLIALSAAALTALSFQLSSKGQISWAPVCISGLSTFVFYGIHYWLEWLFKPHKVFSTPRHLYFKVHKWRLLTLLLMAFSGLFFLTLSYFTPRQYMAFGIFGSFALVYSFKIIPGLKRLKDHRWIKLGVLSGIWTALTLLIWEPALNSPHFPEQLMARFCLMVAICLPFDLRDTFYDRKKMGVTLYDSLGLKRMLGISLISLCLSMVLLFSFLPIGLVCMALGLCFCATALLICKTFRHPGQDSFYLYLDGHLIIYPLVLQIALFFK